MNAACECLCTKRGFLFVGSTDCHLLLVPFCSSATTNDQAACGVPR
jgi:hypothetical protein